MKQITDAYESISEKKSTLIIDGVDVDNVRLENFPFAQFIFVISRFLF